MVGVLVNERCNLVRVLDPVREGRSNKLALNLIFSVKAYTHPLNADLVEVEHTHEADVH